MNLWYEVPIVLAILLYKLTVLRVLWNWSDTRTFAAKTTETFDLVHEWVGDRVKPFKQWKDAMCWIPVCFLFYQSPYHGWAFIKCFATATVVRPFFFLATIMPLIQSHAAKHRMKSLWAKDTNILLQMWRLTSGGKHDYIYSSHMCLASLSVMMSFQLQIQTEWQVLHILWLLGTGFMIAATRDHYSIDVLVALTVCFLGFSLLVEYSKYPISDQNLYVRWIGLAEEFSHP